MARRGKSTEEIIGVLREAEVRIARGETRAQDFQTWQAATAAERRNRVLAASSVKSSFA
jgi:hypothetical protein